VASDDGSSVSLAASLIDRLDLEEPAKEALRAILSEMAGQYQQAFVTMLETQRMQASALDRLQTTLQLLIEKIAPEIKDRVPVPIRLADGGEGPDLASAVVVADPIATGYKMSQSEQAAALQLPQADVSVLVRALELVDDGDCAVVVRKGAKSNVTNYHPRAIVRFRELVNRASPADLEPNERSALDRVRRKLGTVAT
jgi:hypothetical protein